MIPDDAEIGSHLTAAIEAAREAMANAAKHSESDNISLYSEFANGKAHIHVRDDGSGFADDIPKNRVRERLARRLERVGGLLEIDTTPKLGTEIKITVRDDREARGYPNPEQKLAHRHRQNRAPSGNRNASEPNQPLRALLVQPLL